MTFSIITWIVNLASILGVILNINHRRECFYIWAVTNASWAIIDFYKGIHAQGVLFTVYFFLALWGIYCWRKKI